MPTLPPRVKPCPVCLAENCTRHTNAAQQSDAQRKRTDPNTFLRNKRVWRDRTSPSVIGQNVICQRIKPNYLGVMEQCRNQSQVVHHRIGPNGDAHKFFSVFLDGVSQLIALCEQCHGVERDPGGTPEWVEGRDFVRTNWKEPRFI